MEMHRKVDNFLDSPSTLRMDVTILSEYLESKPKTSPVQGLLPADEVEERLHIAGQVQAAKWIGLSEGDILRAETLLTVMELSIIMTIPLGKLRELREKIPFEMIRRFLRFGT